MVGPRRGPGDRGTRLRRLDPRRSLREIPGRSGLSRRGRVRLGLPDRARKPGAVDPGRDPAVGSGRSGAADPSATDRSDEDRPRRGGGALTAPRSISYDRELHAEARSDRPAADGAAPAERRPMKRLRRPSLLLLMLLVAGLPAAEADPVGLSFLKIGAGAESVAMADAVVSNVDGPTAAYWNPGALGFLPGFQAGAAHNESFQSVRQEFAGITRSFGPIGAGLSFVGTWTDNLDAYDDAANYLGEFAYYGISLAASGGYRINDTWGAGLSVKYLQEVIDEFDATGVAFDFGVQGRRLFDRFDVGLAVLHVGPSMEYVDDPFDLPLTVQGGVTMHIPLASVRSEGLLAAEVRKVRGEDAGLQLGAEYRIQQMASLRIGYRSGLDTEDVSFGIGLRKGSIRGDYAYVPFGEDLGSQHRIGLTVRR
ncbi:MAG: PorV/PorQ family protein [Candidatus Eisenbacteria bacterium]|nr:PorV/PorQ family protein [Candidatus Latescibacterota bacterium]MBD3302429.1 PorV/PorQ family protein [Candidatus Eisenbacteria bacterium]